MIMHAVFEATWRLAGSGADSWNPDGRPEANSVTPGVIGFVFMALIAIAMMLLAYDMNRRIRRIQFRHEARERIAAEQAAAGGVESPLDDSSGESQIRASQHDE